VVPLRKEHEAIIRKLGARDIISLHHNETTYILSWGVSPLKRAAR
jgi:hypothetical protein